MPVTANSIITPQAPKSGTCVCTTANTTYTDAPINVVVLITAGANGARVTRVEAIPRATVAATQLQLFRDGDGAGTLKRFFNSRLLPAYNMSPSTQAAPTDFGYSESNPLVLAPGEKIYAAIGVTPASSGTIGFAAEWADY